MAANGTALATASKHELTREQVDLLKRTVAKGCSDTELGFFLELARSKGLDPFTGQIHMVMRREKRDGQWIDVATPQVGIDGYRVIAQRTGQLDGQDGPYWCGEDGHWTDVWLASAPPKAAKLTVYRKDARHPFTAVALFSEYVQTRNDRETGKRVPNGMWLKMPSAQLAKCAEALALRKAFPEDLGGLYTHEEMAQATSRPVVVDAGPDARDTLADALAEEPSDPRDRRFGFGGKYQNTRVRDVPAEYLATVAEKARDPKAREVAEAELAARVAAEAEDAIDGEVMEDQ